MPVTNILYECFFFNERYHFQQNIFVGLPDPIINTYTFREHFLHIITRPFGEASHQIFAWKSSPGVCSLYIHLQFTWAKDDTMSHY